MKFDCDQCGTRYNIADEKVRRKVLKIRCRVCENVITVRGADLDKQDDTEGAPAEAGSWFAAPEGEELGPMTLQRLQDMVETGEVAADTLVWCEGMPDWIAVGAVPELVPHLPKVSGLDDEATSTFELHDRIDDSLRQTLLSTPPPRAVRAEPSEPDRRPTSGIGWETPADERPTVAEPRIGPLVADTAARASADPQRRMLFVLIGLAVIVLLALVAAMAWWFSQPASMRPVLVPGVQQPAQPGGQPAQPGAAQPGAPQPGAPQPGQPPGGPPGAAPGQPAPTPPAATPPPAPTGAALDAPPETLKPAEVEAVIAGHKGDIEDCRARHMREAGKLPDRAVLSFELRPSGRVSNPRLDPPLTDTVFARCLQEAARAWRFPVFTGEPIPVQYPFEWAVR